MEITTVVDKAVSLPEAFILDNHKYIELRFKAIYGYNIAILRIPDRYDAKIVKIGNFWTFSPVIQLIYHLGLLAKLQTKTSRSCIFSLFLPHKYQVSLIGSTIIKN